MDSFKGVFTIVILTQEILVPQGLWNYYKGFPYPLCLPSILIFHITSSHRNDNPLLIFSYFSYIYLFVSHLIAIRFIPSLLTLSYFVLVFILFLWAICNLPKITLMLFFIYVNKVIVIGVICKLRVLFNSFIPVIDKALNVLRLWSWLYIRYQSHLKFTLHIITLF